MVISYSEPAIKSTGYDQRSLSLFNSGNLPPLYKPSQQSSSTPPQQQQSLPPQSQQRSTLTSAISTVAIPPLSLPQSPNVPPQYITEKYYVIDKEYIYILLIII